MPSFAYSSDTFNAKIFQKIQVLGAISLLKFLIILQSIYSTLFKLLR